MSDITLRRTRYVLAGTWPVEHANDINDNGWSVANAPRPLIGSVTWDGPFICCGVFYAAGPYDQFARRWLADDATLLVPVTPTEVVAKLRDLVVERGYDFDEIAQECPEQFELWAEDFALPWEQGWLTTT